MLAIWKISQGDLSTAENSVFAGQNVIVVHNQTKPKAISKKSQGENFMKTMRKGDYFYLCYGNKVQLLGQLVTDEVTECPEKKDGWFQRKYNVLAESQDKINSYKDTDKWWTPNDNSTCIQVPETDYPMFEDLILQPYFKMTIDQLMENQGIENLEVISTTEMTECHTYTKEDFLRDVFITEQEYNDLVSLLKHKQNVIIQGAPGVGKTYAAKKLAYSIMGKEDDSKIEFVQFHQNYSYEDFVMGYKPKDNGFELQYGIFYRFCQKAGNDLDNRYYFIIDEINRGNLSKIFGELLMLIENDKRGKTVTLAYNGQIFTVPGNIYIIGLMNTADRSLAMIDYALRRRFSFFEMVPGFASVGFEKYRKTLQNETFDNLIKRIQLLNKAISNDESLGKGFCIGHSYFCNQKTCTAEWMKEIVEYDILPMLREYWFDDQPKVKQWEDELRGVLNGKIQ
jgi:5-methylcytosine-specific restriction protein B